LPSYRVGESVELSRRKERYFSGRFRLWYLTVLGAVCFAWLRQAHPQEMPSATNDSAQNAIAEKNTTSAADSGVILKQIPAKRPVESEIAVMGMIPDGDYRLFSATVRCTAWTVGMEYDRQWGHFFKARFDYVAEVLPFVLLSQPAVSNYWGSAISPNQQLVPGVSISPFGFRWLWLSNRSIKPYVVGKLGSIAFTEKAFSPNASYANFNVQAAFGVQFRISERVDLRVEPFEFFHVSNGYLARSNPGMDQLATRIGVSYRLRKKTGSTK
jgi:hypothetical protein